jgi:hypothetical protein
VINKRIKLSNLNKKNELDAIHKGVPRALTSNIQADEGESKNEKKEQ